MENKPRLLTTRAGILLLVFILCSQSLFPSLANAASQQDIQRQAITPEYIILPPTTSNTTYLIDSTGSLRHFWPGSFQPGEVAYLLDDGSILRTMKLTYGYGGAGGGLQRISWNGAVLWDFRYINDQHLSHHDIKPLPNGDVLMIAWEYKTRAEALAAGRNPSLLSGPTLMPDEVIEVKPSGPTSGDIVWEWHVWDHLIQDFDASKENYGVVGDHPELIDLNYGYTVDDWLHTNSIDYNVTYDQILLSVRNFNEVWVIDHSTTTEEAAGHTGGHSGHGGDLLFRWGNPQAYRAGTAADQRFYGQHDASWIESGCPGAGDILVFNNGLGRPVGTYSSVEEIQPPRDGDGEYAYVPGTAYAPLAQTWVYNTSFFCFIMGGAQRLRDGETLICSPYGDLYRVTPEKTVVWHYENPYPNPTMNGLFKCHYYYGFQAPSEGANLACEGSLRWSRVRPGETVTGSFTVRNIGGQGSLLNWTVNASSLDWGNWSFSPSSGQYLTPEDGDYTVNVSVVIPQDPWRWFHGSLRVENRENPADFEVIPIRITTPVVFGGQHPILQWLIDLLREIVLPWIHQSF